MTTVKTSLWKPGNKGNIEFVASFKRLERESPDVYRVIEQREGFTCQKGEFEYHVGRNQYGLWLSRRRLGLEGLHNIEKDTCDKPPVRPPMNENIESELKLTQDEIIYLKQLVAFMKVVK